MHNEQRHRADEQNGRDRVHVQAGASVNQGFLSTIMWDGREPSLESQAVDATLGHAQANTAPTAVQQSQIVAFEKGIFTAQVFDNKAHDLTTRNATGGPVGFFAALPEFFIGINDPLAVC